MLYSNPYSIRARSVAPVSSKFGKTGFFKTGACDFGEAPVLKPELPNGAWLIFNSFPTLNYMQCMFFVAQHLATTADQLDVMWAK